MLKGFKNAAELDFTIDENKVNMVEGMNYLKIVAKTKSGGENTSLWKYEYKPTN